MKTPSNDIRRNRARVVVVVCLTTGRVPQDGSCVSRRRRIRARRRGVTSTGGRVRVVRKAIYLRRYDGRFSCNGSGRLRGK